MEILMGTDDLHHKRKQRSLESQKRKKAIREPYHRVLIGCEGEKSEPYYLASLCEDLKINKSNVDIVGEGVDPLNVVKNTMRRYLESRLVDSYDAVYFVFDKDEHKSYQAALNKIEDLSKNSKTPINAITSYPSFEFWLLLHFERTTSPYAQKGNKSASDQVCIQLKKHISDYKKGNRNIYEMTKSYLSNAIDNAKFVEKQQKAIKEDNPSTNFHYLVQYLQQLKK
jgi:RloB-like protein